MRRKSFGRWASVFVALVLTVAVVAVLSFFNGNGPKEIPEISAQSAGPAELSAPALGQQETPVYVSIGGFVLILLVPALGCLALVRPKKPPKPQRRSRSGKTGASSRKTRV